MGKAELIVGRAFARSCRASAARRFRGSIPTGLLQRHRCVRPVFEPVHYRV